MPWRYRLGSSLHFVHCTILSACMILLMMLNSPMLQIYHSELRIHWNVGILQQWQQVQRNNTEPMIDGMPLRKQCGLSIRNGVRLEVVVTRKCPMMSDPPLYKVDILKYRSVSVFKGPFFLSYCQIYILAGGLWPREATICNS